MSIKLQFRSLVAAGVGSLVVLAGSGCGKQKPEAKAPVESPEEPEIELPDLEDPIDVHIDEEAPDDGMQEDWLSEEATMPDFELPEEMEEETPDHELP